MYENIWIKVAVNMFNGPKSKIIDTYDKNDTIHYVWFRCMTLAGAVNDNGYLYINEEMPYTIKTLAIEFNRSVEDVKYAIKVLKKLQMIEYTEDKLFRVKNWTKHQNVDALEKIRIDRNNRVAKHRAKIKSEKINKVNQDNATDNNQTGSENTEIENNSNKTNKIIAEDSNSSTNNIINEEIPKVTENNTDEASYNYDVNNYDLCNTEELKSNVTCNIEVTNSNVAVTDKIKNKKKAKNKEIEIDSEEDNILEQLNTKVESKELADDKLVNSNYTHIHQDTKEKIDSIRKSKDKNLENYNSQELKSNLSDGCERLAKYHESVTGRIGGLETGKLRGAIALHGEANVKMAIDAAIKVGKDDINYINGILSNWRREGYPKDDMEEKKYGTRGSGKTNTADKNEFAGFKSKKPRSLTEDERNRAEENLI